uniref:HPt domain-containing protein n=1 Tax=Eucampia antarctica TaxID=49252 RepID=A0A7S2WSE6_9STRA|mmetsp:Transcript_9782/g.9440  ORF Transcript_9782/g.9440 Transcript_9782/m.9440 type:complete len:125 (+) Transcript_9782:114-488(+)
MTTEIIDWEEAMEQCGDDEEFLRELLGDLRQEVSAQILKIDGVFLTSPTPPDIFHLIMRAAHVVKGSSSNLMCKHLQETSTRLEESASFANKSMDCDKQNLQIIHSQMRVAFENYKDFLISIGV